MKLKVGIISYGDGVFLHDIAQKYLTDTITKLSEFDIELCSVDKIILSDEESDAAIDYLKKSQIDMLIVQMGTFTQGRMLIKLIEQFKETPFFVWGFEDPIVDSFPTVPLNSLTVLNMFTSFLIKLKKSFEYAYAPFESKEVEAKLKSFMKVLTVKKQLKNSKYAIIGSRVPGFYLNTVDELRFRDCIGPELEYYSIATWIDSANKINDTRAQEHLKQFYENNNYSELSEEVIEKNIRLELALQDYIEENNITAVSIKCWPELQALYGCSACAILSLLNDRGIVASCEGDITGLATMDILHRLSGKTIYFGDPIGKSVDGALKMWHCGVGPLSLAKDKNEIEFTHQATMRQGIGMGVQYTMKTGRATICKLSEKENGYSLLTFGGESVAPDRKLLGVQTDVMLDAGFDNVLDVIVSEGIEHHYALVHEDIAQEIDLLTKWMNIKHLQIK